MIEEAVYNEYRTYKKNQEHLDIQYASVDSINVFHFIRRILEPRLRYPVFPFKSFSEIQSWLTEQWARAFQYYLKQSLNDNQLYNLSAQVAEVVASNKVLLQYVREIKNHIHPADADQLIETKEKEVREAAAYNLFVSDTTTIALARVSQKPIDEIFEILRSASSSEEFFKRLQKGTDRNFAPNEPSERDELADAINRTRKELGLVPLSF